MAKLKGLKKVNKIINEFTVKNFGVTAEPGVEFQAFCGDNLINYAFVLADSSIGYFMDDVNMRYPEINADVFLWCLLHEIFHCVTDGQWTKEELEYFEYQKEKLVCIVDDQTRHDWYHAIPDEFFATKRAGEYMMQHPKKIAKFWNKLAPALANFYEKNGLMEN